MTRPSDDQLVKRLRDEATSREGLDRLDTLEDEAADRIEALSAERDALKAELAELAEVAARLADWAALDSAPDHAEWDAARLRTRLICKLTLMRDRKPSKKQS